MIISKVRRSIVENSVILAPTPRAVFEVLSSLQKNCRYYDFEEHIKKQISKPITELEASNLWNDNGRTDCTISVSDWKIKVRERKFLTLAEDDYVDRKRVYRPRNWCATNYELLPKLYGEKMKDWGYDIKGKAKVLVINKKEFLKNFKLKGKEVNKDIKEIDSLFKMLEKKSPKKKKQSEFNHWAESFKEQGWLDEDSLPF